MRSVTFTIIGILALGWGLATLAPPHWAYGELFLLAACLVVVRDYFLARDHGVKMRGTGSSILAAKSAWFTEPPSADNNAYSQAFHPWDLEQAAANTRKAVAGRLLQPAHVVYSQKNSVEQIAHDMLMQAFRQVARTHHPDHGGNPEDMRRVHAARDMILRAIYKP